MEHILRETHILQTIAKFTNAFKCWKQSSNSFEKWTILFHKKMAQNNRTWVTNNNENVTIANKMKWMERKEIVSTRSGGRLLSFDSFHFREIAKYISQTLQFFLRPWNWLLESSDRRNMFPWTVFFRIVVCMDYYLWKCKYYMMYGDVLSSAKSI